MIQPFQVEIQCLNTHVFQIDANTTEEAISIAEDLLDSGEDVGEIVDSEIVSSDAVLANGEIQ